MWPSFFRKAGRSSKDRRWWDDEGRVGGGRGVRGPKGKVLMSENELGTPFLGEGEWKTK